ERMKREREEKFSILDESAKKKKKEEQTETFCRGKRFSPYLTYLTKEFASLDRTGDQVPSMFHTKQKGDASDVKDLISRIYQQLDETEIAKARLQLGVLERNHRNAQEKVKNGIKENKNDI